MKYSVVIPLYNKENYICKTVNSVLSQHFQDYEIIVVNDGSTDCSLEKVSEIKSDKLKIINQENQGVAVARNTGIEHASGEYIAFLDADDEWKSDYLETIDELTEKYPQSDIYVTAYNVIMGKEKVKHSTQLGSEPGCLENYWLTLKYSYDFVWTSATVIKKAAILKAGGFRAGEKIGQDLDLWVRVARNNTKVAYSPKLCVNYNRMAEANARNRVKVAWAKAYIQDLEEELSNPLHSAEALAMIKHKYDLKMTVYIFTCILAGEKCRAKEALKSWKGKNTRETFVLKTGLRIAAFMPTFVNRTLYNIRLKVF